MSLAYGIDDILEEIDDEIGIALPPKRWDWEVVVGSH